MSSGRQTLAEIEATISDLKQREHDLRAELATANQARSDLVEQRLKGLRELAEVRARHAISDGVIDEADRLSLRVANLLTARQKSVEALAARVRTVEEIRAELIAQAHAVADRIEKLEEKLDRFALEARKELASDPDYRRQVNGLDEAQGVYLAAKAKSERAAQDRILKGRAYEDDPLFMYLWDRKYGTSEYNSWEIVEWLDAKVAGLVGYNGARANYSVLLQIPERLAAHVDNLKTELDAKRKAVESLEGRKIRELASTDLAESLRSARVDEEAGKKRLAEVSAELADLGEQVNQYAEGQDAAFRKTIDMSAEVLGQETVASLMSIARSTPTPADDKIVERLRNLDGKLAEHSREIKSKTDELERLFARREELLRIAGDFRRARYDDPGSVFLPEGMGRVLLEELIRGAITGAEYWARTRSRQRWRSRPGDSYRRRESFPPFDGSIFSGGSWSGGGGSGGGDDFTTGGRF